MKVFTTTIGQLKQELIKDYNEVNLQLFEVGVRQQRVDIISDKILFMTVHHRVSAIRSVDRKNREITRLMDVLLIDEFKRHLRLSIENKYGFKVVTILKDYDPETELAATVIVLDREVETYLKGKS
ncbi:DUF2294 domain-containing protein [Effusibacillus consociatus]|uniref:DUF2294 domain-containing protein n=1 Tax=Effusibacillus consociatus TaxID=1117041 RepID=A0ABV9Q3W8_9BACL